MVKPGLMMLMPAILCSWAQGASRKEVLRSAGAGGHLLDASGAPGPASSRRASASYTGEGGGYQHPTPSAGDYLEHGSRPSLEPAIAVPKTPETKSQPQTSPKTNLPLQKTLPRPISTPKVLTSPVKVSEDRRAYSLWEGLVAPLDLPADKVPTVGSDQASQLTRRDYDTHILGLRTARTGTPLPSYNYPSGPGGALFVGIELDLKSRHGNLKDAVADLGKKAGFKPDMRFEPIFLGPAKERVSLWGWLPAAQLKQAIGFNSVLRLQVQNSLVRPAAPQELSSEVLIGIRVPTSVLGRADNLTAVFERTMAELSKGSGFRWQKTIGLQAIPGSSSGDKALVVLGQVPIKRMERLMAYPEVLKIIPSPTVHRIDPSPKPAIPRRFLLYVKDQFPFLFTLTLLGIALSLRLGHWRRR